MNAFLRCTWFLLGASAVSPGAAAFGEEKVVLTPEPYTQTGAILMSLWRLMADAYTATIPRHGVQLLRLWPAGK